MTDATKYGFRAGTRHDFMVYGGASADAMFREDTITRGKKDLLFIAAIFSHSDKSFHVYVYFEDEVESTFGIMINEDDSYILGMLGYIPLVQAISKLETITLEALQELGITQL